ncbi:MAG: hypothetical protein NTY19_18420 [Planctomycetota bacterium]|nr:hypothetical protein [Planctomycetota bacterium]
MIALRAHKLHTKTQGMVDVAYSVLAEHQPMTLRGVHYQMVSRGVYDNTPSNYHRLGRAMTKAREAGSIPWPWIVDHLRQTQKPSSWTGLADFVDTVRDVYRKDFWTRLPHHVEIFVEKDAMAAALQPATEGYDVALHVARGYISTSYCHSVAVQWREIKKPIFAYYLGDWDPSGLDIERDLQAKLERYSGREFEWSRLGVVPSDFDAFDLLSLAPKASDNRAKAFTAEHGNRCAELDAVPPGELRRRVEEAIREHIDAEEWGRLQLVEKVEQETITKFMDQLKT